MNWKNSIRKSKANATGDPNVPGPAESIDHALVLAMVFHPRRDMGPSRDDERVRDFLFPVEEGVAIGARMYISEHRDPVVLFFHGNGEIASDYDDIAPLFADRGMNLLVADYRGYGRSTGTPTLSGMVRDAREVFDAARAMLAANGFTGALWIMGRSLGSAPAIEVANHCSGSLAGLIVESGFADTVGLLGRVGIPVQTIPLPPEWAHLNLDSIRHVTLPTLVIHGEWDEIIPVSDGKALFDAAGAARKELLVIPGAGHNDLLWVGVEQYMAAVSLFIAGGEAGHSAFK
jgi:hypothetical protein